MEDAVLRKKEQKDVELDKKILALRKKNEALIRRYQVSLQVFTFPSSGLEFSARRVKTTSSRIGVTLLHRYNFYTGKRWEQVGRALPSATAPESRWEADSMTCFLSPYHPPPPMSHLSHPFTSYSRDCSHLSSPGPCTYPLDVQQAAPSRHLIGSSFLPG